MGEYNKGYKSPALYELTVKRTNHGHHMLW